MKACHLVLIVGLLALAASPASAQRSEKQRKLEELRTALQTLEWQKVDLAALSLIERCRMLMLLNHALDELGSAALAEADLMGAYLEQHQ
jgi:hypothetical protein